MFTRIERRPPVLSLDFPVLIWSGEQKDIMTVPAFSEAKGAAAQMRNEFSQPAFSRTDVSLRSRSGQTETEDAMLWWALVFFIVAVVAGVLGFGGIASASASIAQILFFIFLVVFVVSLIMGLVRRR